MSDDDLHLTCREVLEFLIEYDQGALDARVMLEFERHIGECPPCIDYVRGYRHAVQIGREACYCDDRNAAVPDEVVHAILSARRAAPDAASAADVPDPARERHFDAERLTRENALRALEREPGRTFVTLFRHGSLEVEIYRPRGVDSQEPHTRDEIYVVLSGRGYYVNEESRRPICPGEVLFAPAGSVHRFESFTDDFVTWVFFYGPEGGERP